MKHPATRNSLFCESAKIMEHHSLPADQYIIRLQAPLTASHARAGSFVHIKCNPDIPMRRPMSIMRSNALGGWIDIMFKIHGTGTKSLALCRPGDDLDLIGPIGKPFKQSDYTKHVLLIGGGVGIPPMIYLAEHIKRHAPDTRIMVIMGSEIPFPFTVKPSQIMVDGLPEGIIATMPLLDDWGVPCRLTSKQGYPGCFDGLVTELADYWLQSLEETTRNQVEIFTCGPTPMLRAVSHLAQNYRLDCQVSMEEFMACAVGGCAGCTVPVYTSGEVAMKRVCVDGPVFEGSSVFPLNSSKTG